MNSKFQNMFKKEPASEPAATEGTPTPTPERKLAFGVKAKPDADATQPEPVSPTPVAGEAGTDAATQPVDNAKPTSKLAGMFGKRVGGTTGEATPSTGLNKPKGLSNINLAGSRVADTTPTEQSLGGLDSLADLASIDVSEAIEQRDVDYDSKLSHFDDEFPATKPVRELPEDLTSQGKAFVEMLDGIYDVVHDSELLGGMLKNVMMEFQDNPQFESLLCDDDLRAFVVAARKTSGLARIKKTESKAKRGTGSKSKSKALDEDMLNDLKMLEGL